MIAVTQLCGIGPGKENMAKRIASGNTETEAIRLLRRRISVTLLRALRQDLAAKIPAEEQPLLVAA